ncbi:MAG: hypothetical protein KDA58_08160 [Planctomycetaceae bacterium]|nr:hypothetical protein [Planctomycetaceae bacterium]
MHVMLRSIVVGLVLTVLVGGLRADDLPRPISAAILPFEARGDVKEEAVQVTELLFAELLISEQVMLVERTAIDKVFEELKLSASGAVKSDEATSVGKLTGARLLITGSVLQVNGDLYLVAKVVGTETSRLSGASVKGAENSDIGELVAELAAKINDVVEKKGDSLLPKVVADEDWLADVRKQLDGKDLPSVTVLIAERHVGEQTLDPAAQTEVERLLTELGLQVIDAKSPKAAAADIQIKGEAFSEFATRRNDLTSVKCRVEIQCARQADGKVLASDAETTIAIDLAEQIAAKSGLQSAARTLVGRIAVKLAKQE